MRSDRLKRYIIITLFLFSVVAEAECVYPSPYDRWGWDEVAGISCDRQNQPSSNSTKATIIRVSWGLVNNADRYEVNYSINGSGWAAVPVVHNSSDLLLTDSISWPEGELCIRLRAGNDTEWSEYSDTACIDVPPYDDGSTSNSSVSTGIEKPGRATIVIE